MTHSKNVSGYSDRASSGPNRLSGSLLANQNLRCIIQGCEKRVHARGWCQAHYSRWLRNGDPLAGMTGPDEAGRFFREVVLACRSDECLIWPFSRTDTGYAQIWVGGKNKRAHRLACEAINGPAMPSMEAAHSCGNGSGGCVNPLHLTWKTRAENIADQETHGTRLRGSDKPKSKLTEGDVLSIRRSSQPIRLLAEKYCVSSATIDAVIKRKTWRHI